MLVHQVCIPVLSCIDTERLTYLKLRSQAIGSNEYALTNHLLRYIHKSFNAIHGFVCVLKTTCNNGILFYFKQYLFTSY